MLKYDVVSRFTISCRVVPFKHKSINLISDLQVCQTMSFIILEIDIEACIHTKCDTYSYTHLVPE